MSPRKLQRGDPVWFRLIARPPIVVVFPSITWTLEFISVAGTAGSVHYLDARSNRATTMQITETFQRRAELETDVFVCFATKHCTIAETIMRRLVRDGHAAEMSPPVPLPPFGRGLPW